MNAVFPVRARPSRLALVTAVAAIVVAACSGSAPTPSQQAGPPDASAGPDSGDRIMAGAGVTVAEALLASPDQVVLVKGALVVAGGEARLCAALTKSLPPTCAGPSLIVGGLDPATVGLTFVGEVGWAFDVVLVGEVADGVLTVSDAAL